jgi:hypothetical protein
MQDSGCGSASSSADTLTMCNPCMGSLALLPFLQMRLPTACRITPAVATDCSPLLQRQCLLHMWAPAFAAGLLRQKLESRYGVGISAPALRVRASCIAGRLYLSIQCIRKQWWSETSVRNRLGETVKRAANAKMHSIANDASTSDHCYSGCG